MRVQMCELATGVLTTCRRQSSLSPAPVEVSSVALTVPASLCAPDHLVIELLGTPPHSTSQLSLEVLRLQLCYAIYSSFG